MRNINYSFRRGLTINIALLNVMRVLSLLSLSLSISLYFSLSLSNLLYLHPDHLYRTYPEKSWTGDDRCSFLLIRISVNEDYFD